MKRFLLGILCLVLFCTVAACGGSGSDWDEAGRGGYITLRPEEILTIENATEATAYALVAHVEESNKKSSVLYCSEPAGKCDVIGVELYQPSKLVSEEQVREGFREVRTKRTLSEPVEGLGCEAFIAIPSIHLMKDGYHVVITAGSGGDEKQKELLINLAKTAIENMNVLTKNA